METSHPTDIVLARLEAKLDVALADTRAQLAEQGRRIGATEQGVAALDSRCRLTEIGTATTQAAVEEVRRSVEGMATSRAANGALILGGVGLLLTLAQAVYGGTP